MDGGYSNQTNTALMFQNIVMDTVVITCAVCKPEAHMRLGQTGFEDLDEPYRCMVMEARMIILTPFSNNSYIFIVQNRCTVDQTV